MLNGNWYRMIEKQDLESPSEPGIEFEAFNISEAKRISTRRQKVKGTVLVLEELTAGRTWCQSKMRSENGRTRKRHPTKDPARIWPFFFSRFPLPVSSRSIQFVAGAPVDPIPQSIRDFRPGFRFFPAFLIVFHLRRTVSGLKSVRWA